MKPEIIESFEKILKCEFTKHIPFTEKKHKFFGQERTNPDFFPISKKNEKSLYQVDTNDQIIGLSISDYTQQQINSLDLTKLKHLTKLVFINNKIEDISFLKNFPKLKELNLSNNNISCLKHINFCKKLELLNLDNNNIIDFSILNDLPELELLGLSENKIKDISSLYNSSIKRLFLDKNNITDITSVKDLHNIKILNLENNNISEISPLYKLQNLNVLILNNNKISKINGLEQIASLNKLHVNENRLSYEEITHFINSVKNETKQYSNYDFDNIELRITLENIKSIQINSTNLSKLVFIKDLKVNSLSLPNIKISQALENIKLINSLDNITLHFYQQKNKIAVDGREQNNLSNTIMIKDGIKSINLSYNNLTEIPDFSKIENVESVDLSYNQIRDLTILTKYKALKHIMLSNNEISDISTLSNFNFSDIDLSKNKISNFENVFAVLNCLKEDCNIKINNNIFKHFVFEIRANKVEIAISDKNLKDISFLAGFENLSYLFLNNCSINDISPLKEHKELEDLYLDNNQIEDISPLFELTNLKHVNLLNNLILEISQIVKFVNSIKHEAHFHFKTKTIKRIEFIISKEGFKDVDLQENELVDEDIKFIKTIDSIKTLNLSFNNISNTLFVKHLKYLTSLNLSENFITDISGLNELQHLKTLDLSGNTKIKNLQIFMDLNSVENLYLENINIYNFYFLLHLSSLKKLSLEGNKISDITALKEFRGLEEINLSHNEIKEIPSWITRLKLDVALGEYSHCINLEGNPIKNIPLETVKQGRSAMKNYFKQQEKYGKEKVYEAKILVVGEGEAGKTSLIKKLIDEKHQIPSKEKEKSTLGVEIEILKKFLYQKDEKITITSNIWDFGGQDIQYALHQYFISDEALYILVSNSRKGKTRYNYWFNTISLLASKNSRVIVLFNKFKDETSQDDFDTASYKRDFPNLDIEVINTDLSKNDTSWELLKQRIAIKLSDLPIVGSEGIKVWGKVRKKIKERIKENSISSKELYKLAEAEGMDSEDDISFMLEYFHKIGIIIYYPEDSNLSNDIFLNPNWITRAIYDVLSIENNHENGQISKNWLFKFWKQKGYKQYDCNQLLNLMQKDKFDLCYKLPNQDDKYIVPILLSDITPNYTWNKDENVQLRYVYERFMPKGVISQFIVRMNKYIAGENTKQIVWKTGVKLEKGNTRAKIIELTNGREIHIRIEGENKIDLRRTIMDNIDSIISRYPKQPEIKIPCNCNVCEKLDEPHFFNYSDLLKRKAKNITSAGECDNCYQPIKIANLLSEYEIPVAIREKIITNYLESKNIKNLILQFHKVITELSPARFFKNANESTFHILLFDWFKQFTSSENYNVQIEVNSPNGEIDLVVKSFPNATVPIAISDIIELKYIPKNSTDTRFEKELTEAVIQAINYRIGEYENCRAVAVVFRGNKDYKIKIS